MFGIRMRDIKINVDVKEILDAEKIAAYENERDKLRNVPSVTSKKFNKSSGPSVNKTSKEQCNTKNAIRHGDEAEV